MSTKSEFTSLDTLLDETFGEKGTQPRKEYDSNIEQWMADRKIEEADLSVEDVVATTDK
ncbi:MAG: hypothetical protein SNG38_08120 [Rikenellaceae bacterium]